MAHYDDDTKKFMDDVSSKKKLQTQVIHSTKAVAKQVARGKPLSEALARQAVVIPTFAALEKQGGLDVIAIFKLLNTHYDRSWWDWEPETIWQTLDHDHGIEPSEAVRNIVQALQMVVSTDQAFEHWYIFEKVGHAFNQNPVNFGSMQPLELDEAALTLKILEKIRPKHELDSEISGYIAACAKNSGVVYLPIEYFPADAQKFLDDMNNNLELKEKVVKGRMIPGDEALQVQLDRLRAIRSYVGDT